MYIKKKSSPFLEKRNSLQLCDEIVEFFKATLVIKPLHNITKIVELFSVPRNRRQFNMENSHNLKMNKYTDKFKAMFT